MRIKRFEAKDTTTALAMIKNEMGEDAVILATRKLPCSNKSGGYGSVAGVEVVAAIDYDIDEISVPPPGSEVASTAAKPGAFSTYRRNTPKNSPRPPAKTQTVPDLRQIDGAVAERNGSQQKMQSESQDLRLRFANLLRKPDQGSESKERYSGKNNSAAKGGRQLKADSAEVALWRDQIIDKIRIQEPVPLISFEKPHIIALVGATGVGKTTTAAKLAAWYNLHQGKKVCLLSMDCYRIGATDQLRTYARIMRLPCEIVLRKTELKKAIQRHLDKDVIIIDTAGKSPYDEDHILELQDWFAPVPGIQPHLVLSATTKKEDILTSLNAYAPLAVHGLVLSKLDETRAYASLCQQVVAAELPVSYLCTGQRVPEDFFVASKHFLDNLFKKGWDAAVPHFNREAMRHS